MRSERPIAWRERLDFQSRVITRKQATGHGISGRAVNRKLKSGAWQRLQRGTYATFSGDPGRKAQLWSAVLRAGPGAVLSHETAAEVHEFADKPSRRIHVTVPAEKNPARTGKIPGVVIHRSRNVRAQPLPPWQLPRTPPEDTVLDLIAASATFDDAYGWLSRAIGRRRTTTGAIREALGARKQMRWRPLLAEALGDVEDGVMFPLERRFARDVERAHGLPRARRQVRRTHTGGARFLDNYYDEYRVCVELDGRSSHPPEQKWQDADRDRDNLIDGDIDTLRFGVRHVTVDRCKSAAELATLFIRRGWDGRGLRPCRPGCPIANSLLSALSSGRPRSPQAGAGSHGRARVRSG